MAGLLVGPIVRLPRVLIVFAVWLGWLPASGWGEPNRWILPIIAYAAVTGAKHVGLVYPGRRSARRTFTVPSTDVRVSLFRVRVVGTAADCERSITGLARVVRRS